METLRVVTNFGLTLLLAASSSATVAQTPSAKAAAASTPAASAVASGQASGTFTVKGKSFKLAYAAAFVDQEDKAKPVFLLLTEQPVPAANWKGKSDLTKYYEDKKPLVGLVFRLDDKREEIGTDYYDNGDYPHESIGIFELNLSSPAGKTLTGSATAVPHTAKPPYSITLNAKFNATLK